jgi:NAD(P)-dependent dehydrogenase (short-subunit alcohol dehydrogenase family)
MFTIDNKVAIVTGAMGLLGKEHCFALAEAGAHVIVCDLDVQACQEFAHTLPTNSLGLGIDVTSVDSIQRAKARIMERFHRIDILVNNAAINDMFENPELAASQSKFENYPLTMLQKSIDVNITGTILCAQIFGQPMAEQGSGSIINIASTYGLVAPDQSLYKDINGQQTFYKSPAYPTTKGAVVAFTRYLASYWGESGVRVNTLSPGGVENGQDTFFKENYVAKTPLKRMAQPDDYRGALIYLASEASKYMTGANLVVDGGWTIW